jgi:predicted dehydrogenase
MPLLYRVAVIGRTGRGNYGHGLDVVWRELPNVQIVAVADDNEPGRVAAQKRLGARNAYADFRDMLRKEWPHIVSVADRHLDQHRDMVLARLARVKELVADSKIFGTLLEMRARGKEDSRAGGEDLMVLGTHLVDLMRFIAGDCRWVFGRISVFDKQNNAVPAAKSSIHPGGEGMGLVAGEHIHAMYGFDKGVVGYFASQKAARAAGERDRFGLTLYGSKGVIQLVTGSVPDAYFLADPSWFPGRGHAPWQLISSAGLGKPEPLKDGGLGQANVWIVRDLLEAIEKDRLPLGNLYDGRAALEMILAVYESFRLRGPVDLPLKNRRHPLASV